MRIKIRNKFYIKVFFCFWIFGAVILITFSFLAGQITLKSWISPREKVFINSYAVVVTNSLNEVKNPQKYICNLNHRLNNTFIIVSSKGNISCLEPPNILPRILKFDYKTAYTFDNYLVSDAIHVNNTKYWLLSKRDMPLYADYLKKNVGYRLFLAILLSALICFLISKYLTSPLKVVVEKMGFFASGDLSSRVGKLLKKRKDEFTEIGAKFDQMADSIEDMISSKQQMLYNISHELRSPLARQLMCLDILEVTPAAEHTQIIHDIKSENQIINDLISEILFLAKLSSKSFSYAPSKQNISEIIKNSISNVNFEYETACVKYKGEDNIYAYVDKKLITILVENLLRNSIKYSGVNNSIIIHVAKKHAKLLVSVFDKGPGIADDDLITIFEPFKQSTSKNKSKTADQSYGLGLAISKEIVLLHNGTIYAENLVPTGLAIHVTLPFME